MKSGKFILSISEYFTLNENWYHGTPDSRELDKKGFTKRTTSVDYIDDIQKYRKTQEQMRMARENDDMETYHELLDKIGDFKKTYTYQTPIFLSDKLNVAKTYADPQRAFDYQNATQKVYKVDVDCDKVVKIIATGDRFRFISVEKVKNGFINAGVSEDKIDELINKFNYYVQNNKGIKTDVIAAIGSYLGFDCIDVVGVLDSYHGGRIRSTVRMVLDHKLIRIV